MALKSAIKAILLLCTLTCIAACGNNGCLDNQSAIPLAGFYSADTDLPIGLNVLEIHGIGAPNDTLLVSSGRSVQQVYLPFRSTMPSVAWCLHYTQSNLSDPAFNDTIDFTYTTQPYFVSEECGASFRYHITNMRYTTHLVDSVAITDSLITNIDTERIKIFFRTTQGPEEPEEPDSSDSSDSPPTE